MLSHLNSIFVYADLLQSDMLAAVIQDEASQVTQQPASVDKDALDCRFDTSATVDAPAEKDWIEGIILSDMSQDHRARLAFFYTVFGAVSVGGKAQTASDIIPVKIYCSPSMSGLESHLWSPVGRDLVGVGDNLALALRLIDDVMALYGQIGAAEVAARLPRMRARAQSARMAQTAVARGVGLEMTRDLVHHQVQRQPYSGFFAVEEHDVSFQKFDGTHSPVVTRAVFVSSDAAIVLPYDPVTDRVLLVEQFRAGPYIRGDRYPWCLEPIAGLIDAGETPAQAALREAKEEAGLDLKGLELISQTYPSPGSSAEFFHLYLGLADLPASTDLIAGLATETEDIRSHIFTFSELMDHIDLGSFSVGPTVLAGLWLARNRDRLRATG